MLNRVLPEAGTAMDETGRFIRAVVGVPGKAGSEAA
jgi:hypothetical protein